MSKFESLTNSFARTALYLNGSDEPIVIDDERNIVVPDSLKCIAVQYDHNIETVRFDCPRYWDQHDMSQMKIYINYMLPNGQTGQYWAQNVTPNKDRMTFDWTVSGNVTAVKGQISILVCAKKVDADGNETQHWNSKVCRDFSIAEGLECSQTIETEYPDIITQILEQLGGGSGGGTITTGHNVYYSSTEPAELTDTDLWMQIL